MEHSRSPTGTIDGDLDDHLELSTSLSVLRTDVQPINRAVAVVSKIDDICRMQHRVGRVAPRDLVLAARVGSTWRHASTVSNPHT